MELTIKKNRMLRVVYDAILISKPLKLRLCSGCMEDNGKNPIIRFISKYYNDTGRARRKSTYHLCVPCSRGMSNPKIIEALKRLEN